MIFQIISNPTKKPAMDFSAILTKKLNNLGHTVIFNNTATGTVPDVTIVIGGDGTILRRVSTLIELGAPILALNFGNCGYLTTCEPTNTDELISRITSGECSYDDRILLEGEALSGDGAKIPFIGLNEAVIHRGTISRSLSFTININGNSMASFNADGIIIATPTGSTAYNLSAGGPILMPSSRDILITPICSSGLFRNSIVMSDIESIKISIAPPNTLDEGELPILTVDGREKHYISFDSEVLIRRAQDTIRIYNTKSGDFLKNLTYRIE
ncbi:MAG: NAD(+)/NADH kinase [Eubacteriales bacterium]|nr:NAD(+)/NADH kinase [Eubacteriales bacterium]MDD4390385.1 NAD(+)/NADH kinase [Eubacteriales bacterium]